MLLARGSWRDRTFVGSRHANRKQKFHMLLADLIRMKPPQLKEHYRKCLDYGAKAQKGHARALFSMNNS